MTSSKMSSSSITSWLLVALIATLTFRMSAVRATVDSFTATQRKPNILLVLTDDQDESLHGMFPMRQVRRLIGDAGATFTNAYTSSPLCCPSRASLLSGLYAHNHRTTNNSRSGGCNADHWRAKVEPHALPVLLQQQAGYETFFAGKYLNEYRGAAVPPGWTDFHGLHGNSRYYNYTLRENERNISYAVDASAYLTDVLRDLTLQFLDKRNGSDTQRPFFAMIAPPAPHAPFTPADRHLSIFADIKALRTPNFNRPVSNTLEKHWLVAAGRTIPQQTLATMDTYFQRRWETLLAVDELVAAVVARLEEQEELEHTYIVYTSDNGYHVGQFAQPFDKRQPYETDIHVPLLVRGPDVPSGVTVSAPALLLDLLPTMLEWAQLPATANLDGQSLHAHLANAAVYDALLDEQYRRTLLVQHWGEGTEQSHNAACPWQRQDRLAECTVDADCHCQDAWNNTYACLRHFEHNTVDRLYCEFRDDENFVEAYDLGDDPYQMRNLGYEWLPIERALYSLALANLTRCSGASCRAAINV